MDAPPRRAPPEALRNETARSRAIAHFAAYWLFLLFILAAVFTPRYTRHFYRQTAAVREPLLRNEILDNVFLENAMSAEQVYLALETLLVPHAFQDRYYAGLVPGSVDARGRYGRGQAFSRDDKTLKYRPRYTAMALLALGRVRLRQLRVRADGGAACRAPGFLKAFYATHAGAGSACLMPCCAPMTPSAPSAIVSSKYSTCTPRSFGAARWSCTVPLANTPRSGDITELLTAHSSAAGHK